MKSYKEGVDWDFIIDDAVEVATVPIKILTGPFKDTVYSYGRVAFRPLENGDISLEFKYNVEDSPLNKSDLESHEDFRGQLGDILVSIIESNIERGIDEVRTDYFEEFDDK